MTNKPRILGLCTCLVHQVRKSTVTPQFTLGGDQVVWNEGNVEDCRAILEGFRDYGGEALLVSVRYGEEGALQAADNYTRVCSDAAFPLVPFFENSGTSRGSIEEWLRNHGNFPAFVVDERMVIGLYENAWRALSEEDLHALADDFFLLLEGAPPKVIEQLGSNAAGTHYGVNAIDPVALEGLASRTPRYWPFALAGWDTIADAKAPDATGHLKTGGGMEWPDGGPSQEWFNYQLSRALEFQTDGVICVALTEQIEDSTVWPSTALGLNLEQALGCFMAMAEVAHVDLPEGGEGEPGEPSGGDSSGSPSEDPTADPTEEPGGGPSTDGSGSETDPEPGGSEDEDVEVEVEDDRDIDGVGRYRLRVKGKLRAVRRIFRERRMWD